MTSNSSLAYPVEYYYPEFIDNRTDDPRKSPPSTIPLTRSIDNGIGSTKIPVNTTITRKQPLKKKQTSTGVALDIATDQGLPATDITKTVKTDPKKNLLRDPAERNIPRLIVDQNIIQQSSRTPRRFTTNLDNDFAEQKLNSNQINNEKNFLVNGHANGDLKNKIKSRDLTKQQTIKYVEDEQPIDDYWKKEVYIDNEGVVTIEPLKYDRETYEGPFGLTRKGSFVFYIGMGIFTLLAAVFLIMTGVFYGQNYPTSSTNTGTLAGMCICALAFYLGLQLILIGLWHQKYRQENPAKIIRKSNKHNDSSAHLKTSMEEHEPYNYSYQQPMDYTSYESYANPPYENYANPPYENYANPPYVSTTNEQMLLQQPGAATGAAYYEPVVWPSNVQVETQPDSKFLQPMEWSYGPQPITESPSTVIPAASQSNATHNKNDNINIKKPEKKIHRSRHHHNKKTVVADPPKAQFDSIVPNSAVIEAPLPVLNKAPETNDLLRSIAEMEKYNQQNPTRKNSNRIKPVDDGTENSSTNDHHRHHSRHRHHRRHRHHSCSSCSTCSDRSNEFFSDIGYHHHHQQHFKSVERIITPRPIRTRTPSPPRRHTRTHRSTTIDTGLQTNFMRDSGVTANLEDVPNVRDNRLEQIPVVRRTIIVEPYPAEPSSQILVKPQSNLTEKSRLGKNQKLNEDGETIIYPTSTIVMNKKTKKKKKTTGNNNEHIQDLKLEDVNDIHDDETENMNSTKKNTSRASSKKNAKNAFYD